ncbi:MAG: uracil permease [marine bacterium B5-7]|nr:MAG: uracil permease [marine bacterium B5-7]
MKTTDIKPAKITKKEINIMTTNELGPVKQVFVGAQMLFVAFGALVLVPILTGLDPNVALFTAGLGTLIFHIITGRQIPIFLASSFAFIAPIIYGVQTWGIPATLSGLCAAGLVYVILSAIIAVKGRAIILKILPPVVIGPVIMVIGLSLAPVAVNLATGKSGDGAVVLFAADKALMVSMLSLIVTMLTAALGRGLIRLLPILMGVIAGYLFSMILGLVDTSPIAAAPLFAMPNFVFPEFNWQAILFIVPVAIAPAIEHIGDVLAIGGVTNRNYLEKPGLHRTLLGDGVATSAAALLGGPPNTTYSEVTGAVALTRAFNPNVMIIAAVIAIIVSFSGTLGAFLGTIPTPVMGGIMVLLFGAIAAIGMNTLIKDGRDISSSRNLIIVAITLVFGIGGMSLGNSGFTLQGIGLSAVTAIFLNLVLPTDHEA